MPGITLRQ
jgi:DNA-binding GntR family transcriptional regulator